MKPTCYTKTSNYKYNSVNMLVLPLCGTGIIRLKSKLYYYETSIKKIIILYTNKNDYFFNAVPYDH
jgi:hypothetical protein